MLRTPAAFLLTVALSTAASAEPKFHDLTDRLPLSHIYDGGWEHFVGGGVAVLDCDADGFPDLFAAGGQNPAALLRNTTGTAGATPTFAVVEAPEAALTGVTGAYPLDIDGDGTLDLFVLRVGANVALRGLGDCRFAPANETWGIDGGDSWSTAFSATWEAGNHWPTLAVGNYVDRDDPAGPFRACSHHQLFRPDAAGYAAPEPIAPGYCALSMLFTDWSGNGEADLWISNDRHYYVDEGQEQLFSISPSLNAYGPDDGWQTQKLWGMGIASRDLTGDGRPEIAVTSMADQKLFTLDGDGARPAYGSIAFERGTTAHVPYFGEQRPSTGWHAEFGDTDNDGMDDLFIAKGNVNEMPDAAMLDPNNLLRQGDDGRFVEVGEIAGIGSTERGRGAALVDLNRDGLLDLVVVNRRAPMALYQNITADAGNWLSLQLSQPRGNRDAIGARIELEAGDRHYYREHHLGGGHAGGQIGPEHFGLGEAEAVRFRVRWPDGTMSGFADATANQHLLVSRQGNNLSIEAR